MVGFHGMLAGEEVKVSSRQAITDPTFQCAIEWTRHLATDTPSDVERFDEFLEYLVSVGFADERHELR
jgi:hypothetical protein